MLAQPFIVPATIFVLLALPLILGIMPPNRLYGVRTPKTLSDDRTWHRANQMGGLLILLSGITYLVVAALAPYSPAGGGDFSIWLIHLAAFAVPLLVSLALIRAYLARL